MWHEEVLYYDVHDAETNAFVGGIYFDLYPREGKFPHAAAWPVQSFLKHFRHEFEYMVEHKGRSIVDDLPSVAA